MACTKTLAIRVAEELQDIPERKIQDLYTLKTHRKLILFFENLKNLTKKSDFGQKYWSKMKNDQILKCL